MSIITVAITGASGAPYGLKLLQELINGGHSLYVCISHQGLSILHDETGLTLKGSEKDIENGLERALGAKSGQLHYFEEENLHSPIASGSHRIDAMVVIPCTMKTLSAVANGAASNLIERAADVTLKEKRKLILVPRETPLSAIHLKNMLSLAELGCHIIPAMPAFYNHPKQVQDLVDFVVGRVLDSMGIEHTLSRPWVFS